MLYNLVQCPHRVTMDLFADPTLKDKVSPFVQLLWERGSLYEEEVIEGLSLPFIDLSPYAGDEKERQTLDAMNRREPLIYSARIKAGDLLGDPDLLRLETGGYVAGDIKSGAGEEGGIGRRERKAENSLCGSAWCLHRHIAATNHEVTHILPFRIQALNGRYWSNNGQRSARTLTGSAAIDPTATLQRTPPAAVAHAVSSSGNTVANTPEQHPGRDVVRSLK
jgi:hypothetical protein